MRIGLDGQLLPNLFRHFQGGVPIPNLFEEYREFVPAHAGDDIIVSNRLLELARYVTKHLVARGMAQSVIDVLESVEVYE